MNTSVRVANKNESQILSSLAADTFYETFKPYNTEEDIQAYIKKAYNTDTLSKQLAAVHDYYFAIAFIGDKPIGYIKMILDASHLALKGKTIELEKIYVLKSSWDTKCGAALMQHAIDFCKSLGAQNLFLGVWEENHRAVAFYQKFGFNTFATRQFQLGSRLCDDYMMNLIL